MKRIVRSNILPAFILAVILMAGVMLVNYSQPEARAAVTYNGGSISAEATGTVTVNRFVKFSTWTANDLPVVAASTAVTDKVMGVCEKTATSGNLTRVAMPGSVATVDSGEAIAIGSLLTSGANGKAYVLGNDAAAGTRVVGIALTADAVGTGTVQVYIAPSAAEQRLNIPDMAVVDDALVGTQFIVTFNPSAAGTLNYTVPAGRKLRVVDAFGYKTVGAGAHADDELTLQNNDGSAANIFVKEELNTVADGARFQFDTLADGEMDVAAGNTLDLVALENAGGGCDCIVTVVCVWVAP